MSYLASIDFVHMLTVFVDAFISAVIEYETEDSRLPTYGFVSDASRPEITTYLLPIFSRVYPEVVRLHDDNDRYDLLYCLGRSTYHHQAGTGVTLEDIVDDFHDLVSVNNICCDNLHETIVAYMPDCQFYQSENSAEIFVQFS